MKKITRIVVGVVLIILGLTALLTPLSPGSWLILVGLEVLGWRIILENRLWAWTGVRPDSKVRRAVRRILCLRRRDAAGRRRRREAGRAAPPHCGHSLYASNEGAPSDRQGPGRPLA